MAKMGEGETDRDHERAASEMPREAAALYVVATPIGNLGDVTLRALDVIRSCRQVFAEDTRISRVLLARHGIARPLRSLHQHSTTGELVRIVERVAAGESVAYLTDAGTPGISDPGADLVRRCLAAGLRVIPIPGPSAAATAVSVAGLRSPAWLFLGFLPARGGARREALSAVAALPHALVIYEAPHRVVETVADLLAVFGPQRELVVCRELTKRHEQIARMPLAEAEAWFAASEDRRRGEFVLVIDAPMPSAEASVDRAELRRVVAMLAAELPAAQAARLGARLTGARREDAYAEALAANPRR